MSAEVKGYIRTKFRRKKWKFVMRLFRDVFQYKTVELDLNILQRIALRRFGYAKTGFRFLETQSQGELKTPIYLLANDVPYKVREPRRVGCDSRESCGTFPPIMANRFRGVAASAYSSSFLKDSLVFLPEYYVAHPQALVNDGHMLFWQSESGKGLVHQPQIYPKQSGIMAFGTGVENWYHWLIEILPTVYLARNLPPEYDNYPLVVPYDVLKVPQFKDSLDLVRGTREVEALGRDLYKFEDLIAVDKLTREPMNMRCGVWPRAEDYAFDPVALNDYRRHILSQLNVESVTADRKLFLARGNNRRSYNQDELLAIAEHHGFEAVYPEQLSFKEQVELYATARFIVGPSGAAFANSLFCSEGARLLSWVLNEYSGFCSFSNIATAVGADLRYLFVDSVTPVVSTSDAFSAQYRVPVAEFEAALISMLKSSEW